MNEVTNNTTPGNDTSPGKTGACEAYGRGRIRTFEGVSHQIYSQSPEHTEVTSKPEVAPARESTPGTIATTSRAFGWLLQARYIVGLIFPGQRWRSYVLKDADTVDRLIRLTERMKARGWDDMAAIGERLYFRKFVPRWSSPAPLTPEGGIR